jgi:hypothetical protein
MAGGRAAEPSESRKPSLGIALRQPRTPAYAALSILPRPPGFRALSGYRPGDFGPAVEQSPASRRAAFRQSVAHPSIALGCTWGTSFAISLPAPVPGGQRDAGRHR